MSEQSKRKFGRIIGATTAAVGLMVTSAACGPSKSRPASTAYVIDNPIIGYTPHNPDQKKRFVFVAERNENNSQDMRYPATVFLLGHTATDKMNTIITSKLDASVVRGSDVVVAMGERALVNTQPNSKVSSITFAPIGKPLEDGVAMPTDSEEFPVMPLPAVPAPSDYAYFSPTTHAALPENVTPGSTIGQEVLRN